MKLLKLPRYLLFLIIGMLLLSSCQKNKISLDKAYNSLIVGEPDIALTLLDSIGDLDGLDKDSYMQYIVIYVGAKYETKQDIQADTLIFEAQRYFNEIEKSKYSDLANYYSAQLYDYRGDFSKALESYMHTVNSTSEKLDNSLLVSKSLNNIGYIYYQQELYDSAVVNYQKALSYYDKVGNIDQRKLRILTNIGRAYEDSNRLDSAYYYFNKTLNNATEAGNEKYKSFSLQNLAVVCYGMEEYNKAIEYFHTALVMDITNADQIRQINLYLLNTYNKKGDVKSAKQYADLVIADLPEVTYKYTSKEMYAALAEYYKQLGDYKQAFEYSELEKITKEQIAKEADAPALLAADKNYYLVKKEREVQEFKSHINFLLIIGLIVFCVLFAFVLFIWRNHKKDKAEIRECADKYEILRGLIYSMGKEYPQIEAEIKSMLADE
ncbi:tetratricopeptide repeat protein [Dysgonomonas sp. HDW5B]|uniref:tetratricopeptide repeat protein n=1 Tax=Dysgonomonas sp. HDW5B TaxID=2714927 RepID=UPI001409FFD4|nr:tetratricopeptide repeat protein [Dysgonomonas sp. HDW5B]QIK54047.1 tetratricopeptide repeat protein [Dysgonomonas sp. HDW5B]